MRKRTGRGGGVSLSNAATHVIPEVLAVAPEGDVKHEHGHAGEGEAHDGAGTEGHVEGVGPARSLRSDRRADVRVHRHLPSFHSARVGFFCFVVRGVGGKINEELRDIRPPGRKPNLRTHSRHLKKKGHQHKNKNKLSKVEIKYKGTTHMRYKHQHQSAK